MTVLEGNAVVALHQCRFPVGSHPKKFSRSMSEAWITATDGGKKPRITEPQAELLWKYCYTFRAQIQDAVVLTEALTRQRGKKPDVERLLARLATRVVMESARGRPIDRMIPRGSLQ